MPILRKWICKTTKSINANKRVPNSNNLASRNMSHTNNGDSPSEIWKDLSKSNKEMRPAEQEQFPSRAIRSTQTGTHKQTMEIENRKCHALTPIPTRKSTYGKN